MYYKRVNELLPCALKHFSDETKLTKINDEPVRFGPEILRHVLLLNCPL